MSKTFTIDICTPEKSIFKGEIVSLVVPAEGGYLGVLADHISLVASLVKGKITFRDISENTRVFNSEGNGFLEVLKNEASLILESATEIPR